MCEEPGLLRQVDLLRSAKLMRLAFICQDMADGLMAVNDITGEWALSLWSGGRPLGAGGLVRSCGAGGWVLRGVTALVKAPAGRGLQTGWYSSQCVCDTPCRRGAWWQWHGV